MTYQFGQRASYRLLVHLADLATHTRFACLTAHLGQLLQSLHETEGRLIDDEGLVQCCQVLQACLTPFLLRQEALEVEVVVG